MLKYSPTSIFRDNIITALDRTNTDEDLKKELSRILSEEVKKDMPYLVRPLKKVNKTIH